MIKMRNVLVATDFSETSDAALEYGRMLARTFGASLHVVHVLQNAFTYGWAGEVYTAPPAEYYVESERAASNRLKRLLTDADQREYCATLAVLVGSPAEAILDYALAHGIDLIVMGTHGRSGIAHVLLGSVAERVVRKAPCPVLTVGRQRQEIRELERAGIVPVATSQ